MGLDEEDVVHRLFHNEGQLPLVDVRRPRDELLEPAEDRVEVVLELAVELVGVHREGVVVAQVGQRGVRLTDELAPSESLVTLHNLKRNINV